ncbi:hypothetical protein RU97_GL002636 [Enterococcus canis]|uniref:Gram-positive cocci surface proteins LPxTG domain-containing protein n=1 Tax=Enterococcus canis TaxID=214095 RepID=A0A1L8RCK5_9ENTE|nr:LPXTG cell wall anchor domain-containing protein [Enterococcus canis]OJG17465.1 hypothetical protein RU97_GL002636 [Enterococcus canis]
MKKQLFKTLGILMVCNTVLQAVPALATPISLEGNILSSQVFSNDEGSMEGNVIRDNVSGINYYNVESRNFSHYPDEFYKDLLFSKDTNTAIVDDQKESLALSWLTVASSISDQKGEKSDEGKFNTQMANIRNNFLKDKRKEPETLRNSYKKNHRNGDNDYDTTSDFFIASSLKDANDKLRNTLHKHYDNAGGGRDKGGSTRDLPEFTGSSKDETVLVNTFGTYKTSGTNKKGHYRAVAVVYHNFRLSPVMSNYFKENANLTSQNREDSSTRYASDVANMTDQEIQADQSISQSSSKSVSSSITGSESYGFEESITVGPDLSFLGIGASLEVGFTASQTIEKGWEKGEELTEETSRESAVGIALPPYTRVLMSQENYTEKNVMTYNCPVALNYDVTVVDYFLNPNNNDATAGAKVSAAFKGNTTNAQKDLVFRRQSNNDPQGINWDQLNSNANSAADFISGNVPMSVQGGSFDIVQNVVGSSVEGLVPVKPLDTIQTRKEFSDDYEYNMTIGESFYLDSIVLDGVNDVGAPYYGFSADKGNWSLVDETGAAMAETDIAKLTTDPLTNYTKFTANNPGRVYLKYVMDETAYLLNPVNEKEGYITNNHLAQTAYVPINILGEETAQPQYHIEVSGTLNGIVGADPVQIEAYLEAVTFNEDDVEVVRPIKWEAQRPSVVSIDEAGRIQFNKVGTHKIRAIDGEVKSDWIEVTAQEAAQPTTITVAPATDFAEVQYLTDGIFQYDFAALPVTVTDQYGQVMTVAGEWVDEAGNALTNGLFEATAAGTYQVYYQVGELRSEPVTVEVAARSLAEVEIAISGAAGHELALTDETVVFDLSAVQVQGYDQTGAVLPLAEGEWTCDGAVVTADQVIFDQAGDYFLSYVVAGVRSNEVRITVTAQALPTTLKVKGKVPVMTHEANETFNLDELELQLFDQKGQAMPVDPAKISYEITDTTVADVIKGKVHTVGEGNTTLTVAYAADYTETGKITSELPLIVRSQAKASRIDFHGSPRTGVFSTDYDLGEIGLAVYDQYGEKLAKPNKEDLTWHFAKAARVGASDNLADVALTQQTLHVPSSADNGDGVMEVQLVAEYQGAYSEPITLKFLAKGAADNEQESEENADQDKDTEKDTNSDTDKDAEKDSVNNQQEDEGQNNQDNGETAEKNGTQTSSEKAQTSLFGNRKKTNKPTSAVMSSGKKATGSLPNTGEQLDTFWHGAGILALLASLILFFKKKEDQSK